MSPKTDLPTEPGVPESPASDSLRDPNVYMNASYQCDVVMKGGVTSGVVYPRAICQIAQNYRFRNIGGTSAGAIAAAITAAAELGRVRARPGFPEVATLPEWLGSPSGAGGSNLLALFQPQPETAALFRILTRLTQKRRGRLLRLGGAAASSFPAATILGATPGAVLVGVAVIAGAGWLAALFALVGLVIAILGILVAWVVAFGRRFAHTVPNNGFGLCTGMGGKGAKGPAALTPWLASTLDKLASQPNGQPLTFRDLWQGDTPDPDTGIDLQFMTTSLTHGRPYRVPFETNRLYFHPDEMRRLFPEYVVKWMEDHPRPLPRSGERDADNRQQPQDLRRMPAPPDLPVVVGARLSLSFPLLISAVPLWAVDYTRKSPNARVPERSWFSDGGICSNFPVHFFDSPLPRRPTFALNLRPFHPDYPPSENEALNSWAPSSNGDGLSEWWNRFDEAGGLGSILGFIGAIKNAMQNWVDNTQLKVPGYRDRVAHVSLSKDEGGLNLDMPQCLITRLGVRGQLAADRLARRFGADGDGTDLTWDNHRWIRYRSTMNTLERLLIQFRRQYIAEPDDHPSYADLIARHAGTPPVSYEWNSVEHREHAIEITESLIGLPLREASDPISFSNGAPRPEPELRIVPRL